MRASAATSTNSRPSAAASSAGEATCNAPFLTAYGYDAGELDAEIAAHIGLYVILHEYVGIQRLLQLLAPDVPPNLDELERSSGRCATQAETLRPSGWSV